MIILFALWVLAGGLYLIWWISLVDRRSLSLENEISLLKEDYHRRRREDGLGDRGA